MNMEEARYIAEKCCVELAWRLDHDQAVTVPDLFTEKLLFGIVGAQVGRAELSEQMATRSELPFKTLHCLSNFRVTWADGKEIAATMIATVVKIMMGGGTAEVATVYGEWRVELQRDEEGWKIAWLEILPA